ncbi:transporter substrate-binding domain-containing protein [Chitinivorax sp. B]|uniref:substrate-binding periplasmic protein n=1 Tax=Chitinivorax sp. B TaxID=2502235 RepID=UPI001485555E|nr:transporter substrate-binding domain-containing protein [Chitinivorax sp. B]
MIGFCRAAFGMACIVFSGLSMSSPANAAKSVSAYNTYLYSPFVMPQGGLAAELVDYLNARLTGRYQLQLQHLPRTRLVRGLLKNPTQFDGVVLFLTPRFVEDIGEQHFLWTRGMFSDGNVLLFRGPQSPTIATLNDLQGMRFGGVAESHYQGLDELVAKGLLIRMDTTSMPINLKLVIAGRIDFTLGVESALLAVAREQALSGSLIVVRPPWDPPFNRRILIGQQQPELAKLLADIVDVMPYDPTWQNIAKRYQLKPPQPQAPASP